MWAARSERKSNFYIVSFSKTSGDYKSRIEIPDEIVPARLDVFGSGDFLIRGHMVDVPRPRIAILSGSGSMREVIRTDEAQPDPDAEEQRALRMPDLAARAGDGQIYALSRESRAVAVVDAAGEMHEVFRLPRHSGQRMINDLLASGTRLAVTYNEQVKGGLRTWIAVYDSTSGESLALYGPLTGTPVCYQSADSQDRFTLLTNGSRLVTMAP